MLTFAPLTSGWAAQTSGPLAAAPDGTYIAPAATSDDGAEPTAAAAPAAAAPAAPASVSASAAPAAAVSASDAPTTNLGSVSVTGTAIARSDAATALPVTTYSAESIRQQGITSTAQFLQQVAGNSSSQGAGLSTGTANTAGTSFADLRGLGANKTLILLNGRRLAVNALDGGATDLSSIPFAAIDHVEILRDGASALYGTDAIGGVINFITKKNLNGGNVDLNYSTPTRDGGGSGDTLSATFGKGDLDKDGWNLMGTLSYQHQGAINANDRGFVVPLDPRFGQQFTSINSYPANYVQGSTGVSGNASAPGCDVFGEVPSTQSAATCRENYTILGGAEVAQQYEHPSFFGQGEYKINDRNQVALSYLWSRKKTRALSAPSPTSDGLIVNPGTPFYPGVSSTPLPADPAFDPTQPISLSYRGVPLGLRESEGTNEYHRVILDFTGEFLSGFHYDTAFSYNQSTTDVDLVHGFFNEDTQDDPTADDYDPNNNSLQNAINQGLYNPFDANVSPAERQILSSAETTGRLESDKTRAYVWDGKIDHEIGNWFGAGESALALGAQYRHETLGAHVDTYRALRSPSEGIAPSQVNQDRDVEGVFGELNVPILESLELDAQARYDNYSDVGDTVNPKVSLRYQPIEQLTLRASYSEGFHAPTLYDLYQPPIRTFTNAALNDPVLCPNGTPANGGIQSRDCGNQFFQLTGGNADLEPEKAKSWSGGFVLQPIKYVSLTADFFAVELSQQIQVLDPTYIFDNAGQFQSQFNRNPDGSLDSFNNFNANLGKTETNGEDVQMNVSVPTDYGTYTLSMNGTYINKYDTQVARNSAYQSLVSNYGLGQVIFRWKDNVTLGWNDGPVALGVVNHYESGYHDARGVADPSHPHVHDYITWDTYGSYSFDNGIQLTLGSQNVFDADPPFSAQPDAGQAGYDARYADGIGRTVYGRISYTF